MPKKSPVNRRSASSAKFFFAALCVALGGSVASSLPNGSTLGETWRFRFDSFALFSSNAPSDADEGSACYLDASGRRVEGDEISAPSVDSAPTFFAEATELLASDVLPRETEPVGATFDEATPELAPVSFANAETASDASRFENLGWLVVDDAQERDEWSRELRLEAFPKLTFAESSAPTWSDDVAVAPATPAELRALAFEPGVASSSLVSLSLRRRAANARLVSGDYSFAETSNASDANAPQTSNVAPPTTPAPAPTRVGAFTACGAFDAYGAAKVRVQ